MVQFRPRSVTGLWRPWVRGVRCGSGAGSVGRVRGVCADSWGPWVRLAVIGPGRRESPTPPALKGVQYVVAVCCCCKSLVVDMRILYLYLKIYVNAMGTIE